MTPTTGGCGRTHVQRGNGTVTFQLPNLQARVAVHTGTNFALGQAGGDQMHTVTQSEMPVHKHTLNATTDLANANAPGLALPAARGRGGITRYGAAGTSNANMALASVVPAGGNQPHSNMQPVTVLNYVIALTGIFPPRN